MYGYIYIIYTGNESVAAIATNGLLFSGQAYSS